MQNPGFYTALNDDQLVQCMKTGDERAFNELFKRHHASCSNVAQAILHNPHDAEDETQNALWKAYKHIQDFKSDSKFSTWLTRIVVNQCLMRLRQLRRARIAHMDDARGEERAPIQFPSSAASPEDQVGRQQIATLLRREIRGMPPLLRDVIVLRDVCELPTDEVARRLGISTAAAKSRLMRARLELRSRMRKHEGRIGPAALIA